MLRIASALFFLLVSGMALSQEKIPNTSVWLQMGVNASFFDNPIGEYGASDSVYYEPRARVSPFLGLKVKIKLNRIFSLQPEIFYGGKGGAYRRANTSVTTIGGNGQNQAQYYKRYRLDYIEMPVLLNVNITHLLYKNIGDDRIKVQLCSGISPAINLRSTFRYNVFEAGKSYGPMVEQKEKFKVKQFDHAKNFLLNVMVDLSFNFQDKKGDYKMQVFLRWYRTLDNVYNISELDGYNMDTKMHTVSLGYGIML